MATVILDQHLAESLIAERRRLGQDHYDEVWDGVYRMAAMPNDEHAVMSMRLVSFLDEKIGLTGLGHVRPPVNVSDRVINWSSNFRVPDVAVMLEGGKAVNHGAFWHGGPDFVVEVCSPDEDPHEKISFYESIGVREFLVIDRDPWKLELFRLQDGQLLMVGDCTPGVGEVASEVIRFVFRLEKTGNRPHLVVIHTETGEVRRI